MSVTPTEPGVTTTPKRPRKEIRNLTADERRRFIAAVRELNSGPRPTVYDRLTERYSDFRVVLSTAQQLPWLRQFLFDFEGQLLKVDPSVNLPYWDTAFDSAAPERSPVFGPDWAGGNGGGAAHVVPGVGAFGDWRLAHPELHPLQRAWNQGTRISPWHSTDVVNAFIVRETTYSGFRQRLSAVDGAVHTGIGGDMATFFSPNDPIFYLHTANIDRIWATWQSLVGNLGKYDGVNFDESSAAVNDPLLGRPQHVRDVIDLSKLDYVYSPLTVTPVT